ncbi:hypothetical protein CYY_005449 [Polysphondylium violaceum]|uniref:Uncharacterized protein n=1 Tax=Polysphondylium violaceum TaxID=133409 RepID=A0A8J4PTI8_9MYCE|nr:hypothetical protein CYY_005449 [Polysphondylium violaceum]
MISNKIIIKQILNQVFVHYKHNINNGFLLTCNFKNLIVKLLLVCKEWQTDIVPKLCFPVISVEYFPELDMALLLLKYNIPLRMSTSQMVLNNYVEKLEYQSLISKATSWIFTTLTPQEKIERFYQLIGSSIDSVVCSDQQVERVVNHFIPFVRKLDIYNTYNTAQTLFRMVKQKNYSRFSLQKLFLSSVHSLDFNNIEYTPMFDGLTQLKLSYCGVNFTFVSLLKQLEELVLTKCDFDFNQLYQTIESMPKLTRLSISQDTIGNGFVGLKSNKTIQCFTLSDVTDCKLPDVIDVLNLNSTLVQLNLNFEIVPKQTPLPSPVPLPPALLKKLNIKNPSIDTPLDLAIHNTTLKHLCLKKINILHLFSTDNQLNTIKAHYFNGNHFTFTNFPFLKHLKLDVEYDLIRCPMDHSLFSNLESLSLHTTYQSEHFNWTPLWNFLSTEAEFPKLTMLTLERFPITLAQLSTLFSRLSESQVSTLQIINPFIVEISEPLIKSFIKNVCKNKQLSNLKLKNLGLTSETNTSMLLEILERLDLDKFDFQNNCEFEEDGNNCFNKFKSIVSKKRIRILNFQCKNMNHVDIQKFLNNRGIVKNTFTPKLNKD